jgi:large subunit ribosomal protein L1
MAYLLHYQAVEVASPKAMFELYVQTKLGNGSTIPKGRFRLPKPAKEGAEDKILVFAEGKLASDARRAGAHIVGGLELIDGVWHVYMWISHSRLLSTNL